MVLEIIKGQRTIVHAAREYDLKQSEILEISFDLQEMTLSATIRREVAMSCLLESEMAVFHAFVTCD